MCRSRGCGGRSRGPEEPFGSSAAQRADQGCVAAKRQYRDRPAGCRLRPLVLRPLRRERDLVASARCRAYMAEPVGVDLAGSGGLRWTNWVSMLPRWSGWPRWPTLGSSCAASSANNGRAGRHRRPRNEGPAVLEAHVEMNQLSNLAPALGGLAILALGWATDSRIKPEQAKSRDPRAAE